MELIVDLHEITSKLDVVFSELSSTVRVDVVFSELSSTIRVDFGEIFTRYATEVYSGSYEVTPQTDSPIILETSDKVMSKNLTVKEIPFFSVSNPAGGNTVYIGNEIEFE